MQKLQVVVEWDSDAKRGVRRQLLLGATDSYGNSSTNPPGNADDSRKLPTQD